MRIESSLPSGTAGNGPVLLIPKEASDSVVQAGEAARLRRLWGVI
jgi:hypothetical protein